MTAGRHQVAGGLTVRGTCTAGHVTEATTEAGRTTWTGECGHDGCELKVKAAKRVAPAPVEPPPAPAAPASPKAKRLRQVDYDRAPRKRDQPAAGADGAAGASAPAADRPAAGAGDGKAAGAQPAATAAAVQVPDEPGDAGRSRRGADRIRERITGRRGSEETRPRSTREFRLPF